MMLSRVAESLYWMQRYRERAENIARLVEASLHLNIDAPGDDRAQWVLGAVVTDVHRRDAPPVAGVTGLAAVEGVGHTLLHPAGHLN